ncbi:unknown [Eggerthella sp. CAG:298]|nr:unknown [Eggerthella sp. CAG:298]
MDDLISMSKVCTLILVLLCSLALFGVLWVKGTDWEEVSGDSADFMLSVFEGGAEEAFLLSSQRTLKSFHRVSSHLVSSEKNEVVDQAEVVYIFNGTISANSAISSVAYVSNNPNVTLCEVDQSGSPLLDSESRSLITQEDKVQKYYRIGVIIRIHEVNEEISTDNMKELDKKMINELGDGFLTVRVLFKNGIELEKQYNICYVDHAQQDLQLIIEENQPPL